MFISTDYSFNTGIGIYITPRTLWNMGNQNQEPLNSLLSTPKGFFQSDCCIIVKTERQYIYCHKLTNYLLKIVFRQCCSKNVFSFLYKMSEKSSLIRAIFFITENRVFCHRINTLIQVFIKLMAKVLICQGPWMIRICISNYRQLLITWQLTHFSLKDLYNSASIPLTSSRVPLGK